MYFSRNLSVKFSGIRVNNWLKCEKGTSMGGNRLHSDFPDECDGHVHQEAEVLKCRKGSGKKD